MIAFLLGVLVGLATAFPPGVQSFVVMNQGLRAGYPKVLVGIVTASLCDSLLIVLGVAGASALLVTSDNKRLSTFIGVLFFVVGVMTLRSSLKEEEKVKSRTGIGAMITQTVGVSLLNPHAVFETVGLLGGAIAIQAVEDRLGFAAGAISASWIWFLIIGLGASALGVWLTPSVRLWTQRGSGVLMVVFAAFLALQLM